MITLDDWLVVFALVFPWVAVIILEVEIAAVSKRVKTLESRWWL